MLVISDKLKHIPGGRFPMPIISRILFALSAVFLAMALPVPMLAQGSDSVELTDAPIATETSPSDDFRILRRIEGLFEELSGYENVTVEVRSGVVAFRGRTIDAEKQAALYQIASRIDGVIAVENDVEVSLAVGERVAPVAERIGKRLLLAFNAAPVFVVAAITGLFVAWAGFRIAALHWPWDRIAPNEFLADVLRQIVRLMSIIAGLVLFLDILGAAALMGTILGAMGIFGLAVGFAVRDTVENFIASIMLSLRSPFRPREFVEIGGDQGYVVRLTSRATILVTLDGNHVRIPNATVFKAKITNYSRHPQRRFTFDLSVPNPGNLSGARAIMLDALREADFVLDDPGPAVWLAGVADGAARFTCAGWIDPAVTNFNAGRGEALRLTVNALERAGKRLSSSGLTITLAQEEPASEAETDTAAKDISQDEAIAEIIEEELDDPNVQDLFETQPKDE